LGGGNLGLEKKKRNLDRAADRKRKGGTSRRSLSKGKEVKTEVKANPKKN